MLKNEREKFFLSVIVVLIITGILAWQGIFQVNADIEKNISEVKDKKVSTKVYDLKNDLLPAENKDYDFSKSKIEKINDYFVYADENDNMALTAFYTKLEDLAFQSTQKINSLNHELYQAPVLAPKDKNKTTAVQAAGTGDSRLLKLTFQGDYPSLLKFISYIEALPYYVYIESVNTNINSGSGADKILDKNIPTGNSTNLQSVLIIKIFRKTNIL